MKTRIPFLLLCMIVLTAGFVHAQGVLNKLKNKANQEVNKLEKGTTPKPTPETPRHEAEEKQNKLSANVTRSVLIKLNSDEIFDYGENCIDLGSSLDNQSFVLLSNKGSSTQCYSYKSGIRKPITCPTPGAACNERVQSLPCSFSKLTFVNYTEEDYKKYVTTKTNTKEMPAMSVSEGQIDDAVKMAEAAMTPEEKADFEKEIKAQKAERDGKGISTKGMNISIPESQTINFNGKSYPVYLVNEFYLSPDRKHFYAEVMEDKASKETKIITSASSAFIKSNIARTNATHIFASPDNSEFAVYGLNIPDSKYVIRTSKGKTYPISDPLSYNGAWYSPTGNHIVIYSSNDLYLDGVLVKKLEENAQIKPCDLFISPDGKEVTIKKGNELYFNDGDYFQFPLQVALVNVGGKSYFRWLALENNELAAYQKPY